MALPSIAGKLGIVGDLVLLAVEEVRGDIGPRHAIGVADAARQRRRGGTAFGLAAAERVHLEQDTLAGASRSHLAGIGVVVGSDRQKKQRDRLRVDAET